MGGFDRKIGGGSLVNDTLEAGSAANASLEPGKLTRTEQPDPWSSEPQRMLETLTWRDD